MKNIQPTLDKLAISLSAICTVHCLLFPVFLVLVPSISALQFDNEAFHWWMVIAVIPTSLYALKQGCKKHKHVQLIILGLIGITCLLTALLLGETWEKPLTTIGSCFIILGHILNFSLCKKHENCQCHSNN